MDKTRPPKAVRPNSKLIAWTIAVLFSVSLICGWYLLRQADKELRSELLSQTIQVANALNLSEINTFTGTEADLNSDSYLKLNEKLSIILQTKPKSDYIYLFGRKTNKQVFFLIDTGPENPASPGEIYEDATPELVDLFDNRKPFVEGPLTDEWGNWISAFVPITDASGKLIAVLGIDNDADAWRWDVAIRAGLPISIMLAIFILLAVIFILYNVRSRNSILRSEARLKRGEIASRSGNWELATGSMTMNISTGSQIILGVDRDEYEYAAFRKQILPKYHQLFDDAFTALLQSDKPYDIDFKIYFGSTNEVRDIHSSAIYDQKSRIVFGIFQDITELKRTEEILRTEEKRFRSIFENVSVGLYRSTPEGRILMANPTLLRLLGYSSVEELARYKLNSDGLEQVSSRKLFRRQMELKGEIRDFESVWKRKDDSLIFVRESAKVIRDEAGGVLYYEGAVEDLTARRQAEEALRKSMEENKVMIDANPDIVFKVDKMGTILGYHAPSGKQLYLPPEDFLGKKMTEVLPVEVALKILETIEIAFQSKQMAVMEYELAKDGVQGYFENRIIPLGNDELLSFIRDITVKKKAEETLRYNYSLLRIAGVTAKFGGWSQNLNEDKVIWSDEMANIHGKPKGYSPTFEEAIAFYTPEYRAKIKRVYTNCAENGIPFDEELEILDSNGKRIWVRLIGEAVRDEQGKIIQVQGSFQDISEGKQAGEALRKSEEKFRILNVLTAEMLNQPNLESLYQYMATSLHQRYTDTIIFYNSFADAGDESKLETIVGFNNVLFNKLLYVAGFNPIGKKFKIQPGYYQVIQSGKVVEFENGLYDFTGGVLSEVVASTIEKLIGIHKIYTIGIWKDQKLLAALHFITFNKKTIEDTSFIEAFVGQAAIIIQKMKAEQNLRESELQLKELNATKDKFFSIIAHDLKSPFNSIIGFSNILVRDIEEKDFTRIKRYAGIIQDSSQQALDLLMNLLEWSRSQTGKVDFAPTNVEMGALTHNVVELLRHSADQKSISISTDLPNNSLIYADKAMIDSILRNTISNAIKFTHPGGKISISMLQNQSEWVISVQDNGIGIKKEAIDKLFRLDQSYSTVGTQNEKGTGLGLILCKEFVEKHGGRIWVESVPKQGSRFSFTIPNTKA